MAPPPPITLPPQFAATEDIDILPAVDTNVAQEPAQSAVSRSVSCEWPGVSARQQQPPLSAPVRRSKERMGPMIKRQTSIAFDLDNVMADELAKLTPRSSKLTRSNTFCTIYTRSPVQLARGSASMANLKAAAPGSGSGSPLAPPLQPIMLPPTPSTADRFRVAGLGALLVASGVLTNVAFELLSKREPGCASLLTLFQYLTALAGELPRAAAHLRVSSQPRLEPTNPALACHQASLVALTVDPCRRAV